MIYRLDLMPLSPLAFVSVSGATVTAADAAQFVPWQPSQWPSAPIDDHEFVMVLKKIFEQSMLIEIQNVINDAIAANGSIEHRGHVLAISMLCALDAVSSYEYGAKSGGQILDFVESHFPQGYRPFAGSLLFLYRHATVHSWNLFKVAMTAGNDDVSEAGGILSFGPLNFFGALKCATEDFLDELSRNAGLQTNARARYKSLRKSAKSTR
jgi:hypothetical protein